MNQRTKDLLRRALPIAVPIAAALRHRRSLQKIRWILRERREICIELGAGQKAGTPPWVTIDITPSCDLYWDLRRGIPFPDASVSRIYSSHFFEHLTFSQTQQFLDECRRVLKPGGNFSVCVPNARLYIDAYVNGKTLDPAQFLGYGPAYNRSTPIDYVNYCAYMAGEHKYMFDEENLLFILKSKGFRNVRPREFDPTLDLRERHHESIYAEAEK